MSTTIIHVITDDLDETENAEGHRLHLDGIDYEIDLAAHNYDRLRVALEPFIAAARRVKQERRAGERAPLPAPVTYTRTVLPAQPSAREIRDWWRRNPRGLPRWQAHGQIPIIVKKRYAKERQESDTKVFAAAFDGPPRRGDDTRIDLDPAFSHADE